MKGTQQQNLSSAGIQYNLQFYTEIYPLSDAVVRLP